MQDRTKVEDYAQLIANIEASRICGVMGGHSDYSGAAAELAVKALPISDLLEPYDAPFGGYYVAGVRSSPDMPCVAAE